MGATPEDALAFDEGFECEEAAQELGEVEDAHSANTAEMRGGEAMRQLVDHDRKVTRCLDSLARTRQSLDRYRGTPCEPDYLDMVRSYEHRLAELRGAI